MGVELILFLWILGGAFFTGFWDKIRDNNEDVIVDVCLTVLLWPFAIMYVKGAEARQQRLDRARKFNSNTHEHPK